MTETFYCEESLSSFPGLTVVVVAVDVVVHGGGSVGHEEALRFWGETCEKSRCVFLRFLLAFISVDRPVISLGGFNFGSVCASLTLWSM